MIVTTSTKYNSFNHDLITGDFGEDWTVKALMDIQGTDYLNVILRHLEVST